MHLSNESWQIAFYLFWFFVAGAMFWSLVYGAYLGIKSLLFYCGYQIAKGVYAAKTEIEKQNLESVHE